MKKLDIYRNDNYVLNDAFDQAVMNIHILKKQHGYKSFVITGCETGDGSTTVAINLAAAFASAGYRTVLIDGDMRKKNRYKRLNENTSEGLSDYLMDRVPLDSENEALIIGIKSSFSFNILEKSGNRITEKR